ncbi:MAG: hypothetical protein JNL10_16770 [Verrucomicrobiales bacterium]|nr:hypothetical protein [Verrucomicrobiales bacterium]
MQRLLLHALVVAGALLTGASPAAAAATSQGQPLLPSDLTTLEHRISEEPTNVVVLVWTALQCHNQAAFGAKDSPQLLKRARACLESAVRVQPSHTFARTLLGSAIVISAREPIWPGTRIRRVREGLAVMDAALRENPDDPDARFTRASNNLFLPDLFHRRETVQSDFAWLQERADRGEFAPDFRQYVYLYHGHAQKRWGNPTRARELWEAGLKVTPESTVADELRHELEGHSDLARISAK